jgi:hypothetical protein
LAKEFGPGHYGPQPRNESIQKGTRLPSKFFQSGRTFKFVYLVKSEGQKFWLFVNTTSVQATKRAALAEHRTQQEWLDVSQGMNSYLRAMEEASLRVGKLSRRFRHAEGWRRHSHLGFCAEDSDPLQKVLKANCRPGPSR